MPAPKTAVFWIRDGVLVDRMHVNAVAFAVVALSCALPEVASAVTLTELVNFGFAASGISCADKMRKFNRERFELVRDIDGGGTYYNQLATQAALGCSYFPGACDLLARLHAGGIMNFITSAVEQGVLDAWSSTGSGALIAPSITEILGKRAGFEKGRDHFAYVRQHYGIEKIFYVADAPAEIETGAQLSSEFSIDTIGFAHVVTPEKVSESIALVAQARSALKESQPVLALSEQELVIDWSHLHLSSEPDLLRQLQQAGARHLVSGQSNSIFDNLQRAQLW